jgi:protoporphyrin/coproporphyrin ferrochelatase
VAQSYDAVLVVSFGGPEGPDDVLPFLENVVRRRNVPRERLLDVAEHYHHFGGVSPLNAQNRALVAALQARLDAAGPRLPVYLGNRNWHPMLADTLAQMARQGVRRALAFVTSAYSSYSSCRQYLEDIERARAEVGPTAPHVDKLRVFFNHPAFIDVMVLRARAALEQIPDERRPSTTLLYTAHSIPTEMAERCDYATQLAEAARLVSAELATDRYRLVYQSRSGPPQQPWLGPDVLEALRELATAGHSRDVVLVPLGFLSDHVEILWDLDTEARQLCNDLGLNMVRAETVGSHPAFVEMVRELILERTADAPKRSIGNLGPSHDVCAIECCTFEMRSRRPGAEASEGPSHGSGAP